MDPYSRVPKKNTSHGNEVLQHAIMHLIQRPCYQWESLSQDPADSQTTRRPPDHRKEMQTTVVWLCLPFIRSGQSHLARHSDRGKKRGRQRKKWEDNIREWTDLEFSKSQRAEENKGKWRKLVVKSSVLLQRPLRLRDRWQWWWSTLKKASGIKDISETEKKNIFQTGDIDVHFYLTSIFPLSLLYSSFAFILQTAWLSLLSPMADKHDCKASS